MLWERIRIGRGERRQRGWQRRSLEAAEYLCVHGCVHTSAYACVAGVCSLGDNRDGLLGNHLS